MQQESVTLNWHRLFGLALTDLFAGSAYEVRLEVDLSLKRQLLDVIIIEKEAGEPLRELPDGLDDLANHNLVTYKSLRQPLDAWAIDELIGHFVNYRKQISPADGELLPVEDFRLFGVCTRNPAKLAAEVKLTPLRDGVYETHWGPRCVRIVVLSEVPRASRNALWQLFSAVPEDVEYGASHYEWRRPDLSTLPQWLYNYYRLEGFQMPFTVDDYRKCVKQEALSMMTPEERLAGIPPAERLAGIPPAERLRGLSLEERFQGVPLDELEAFLRRRQRREDDGDN